MRAKLSWVNDDPIKNFVFFVFLQPLFLRHGFKVQRGRSYAQWWCLYPWWYCFYRLCWCFCSVILIPSLPLYCWKNGGKHTSSHEQSDNACLQYVRIQVWNRSWDLIITQNSRSIISNRLITQGRQMRRLLSPFPVCRVVQKVPRTSKINSRTTWNLQLPSLQSGQRQPASIHS